MIHILPSSQYRIGYTFGSPSQADSFLHTLIDDTRERYQMNKTWEPYVPRKLLYELHAPVGSIMPKHKSTEAEGLIKIRIIVSHFHHRSSHEGKLSSRCLSLVMQALAELATAFEIWEMQHCRDFFTTIAKKAQASTETMGGGGPRYGKYVHHDP